MRGLLLVIAIVLVFIAVWTGSEYDTTIASGWALAAGLFLVAGLGVEDDPW